MHKTANWYFIHLEYDVKYEIFYDVGVYRLNKIILNQLSVGTSTIVSIATNTARTNLRGCSKQLTESTTTSDTASLSMRVCGCVCVCAMAKPTRWYPYS